MRKILFVAALVVGLCLSTAVANGAVWTDTDVMTISGTTGYAKLTVEKVSFSFTHKIQPGERLATYWWIRNDGPCPLDVTVTVTGPNWLWIKFYPGLSFNMGSGLAKQVALTVQMPGNSPNSTANEPFTITVTFKSKAHGTIWQYPVYDP